MPEPSYISPNVLLDATTTIYRTVGPEEGTEATINDPPTSGGHAVTHVWRGTEHVAKAPADDGLRLVDVHFFVVQVDVAMAEQWREAFFALMDNWPPDPTYQPESRLEGGPSYIELGAQIGTFMGQQDAMRLMALGEVLGAWHVITPRSLLGEAVSDADANQLAGQGLVMISGYEHPAPAEAPEAEPA